VCALREHLDELARMLSEQGITVATYDGRVPKNIRKQFWESVRSGEVQVVVGIRKMIKLGIDVPLWDTYYYISPVGFAPNYYQEMSRIRTPYPESLKQKLGRDKPTPIIRMFTDAGHKALYACYNIANKVHAEHNFIVKAGEKAEKKAKPKKQLW